MLICLFSVSRRTKEYQTSIRQRELGEAMQEELLQFKLQEVWALCELPDGKRLIGTKWVFRVKRDERRNVN